MLPTNDSKRQSFRELPDAVIRGVFVALGAAIILVCLIYTLHLADTRETLTALSEAIAQLPNAQDSLLDTMQARLQESSDDAQFGSLLLMLATVVIMILLAVFFWQYNQNQGARRQREIDLIASERAARDAKDAESRFLSNMSHEIRNPLNGIIGMLRDILHNNATLDEARESAHVAMQASAHLLTIVNDILDLNKMLAGEFKLVPRTVNPEAHFANQVPMRRVQAEQKGINYQVATRFQQLPAALVLDVARVDQIMFNLVSNAIKFTEQGSVTEIISYRDGQLIIEIADTGIGISDEALQSIFERFTQIEDGHTKKFGGTGLGLAICRELALRMGGDIAVSSVPGEGSVFTVMIPAALGDERDISEDGPVRVDQAPAATELTGTRILCVDDSEINLKIMIRPLQRAGADIERALSGDEALALALARDFDVVLTDISMPGMDGEELLSRLKQSHPQLPIVAVTGNVYPEDVERYLSNGFAAVLPKPVDPDTLLRTVSATLQPGDGAVTLY